MRWSILAVVALATLGAGCAIVHPGQVGVKRTLGRLDDRPRDPGPVPYNPLFSQVVVLPTQTVNLEVELDLPSREGMNIRSQISILYRIRAEDAPKVIQEIGLDYEDVLILSTFRSAAADVSAQFFAKDMYTAARGEIERKIRDRMMEVVAERGFEVEQVLMKSIQLPPGLVRAIEDKLRAEQEAEAMEFVLERERLEAERKAIEAEGIRRAQTIVTEGLTPALIQWNGIEAFRELATSPNAKVIVMSGSNPLVLDPIGASVAVE